MHFHDISEGDYRIYAGAREAPRGDGYIAAVVVNRVRGAKPPREVYRDESVACGYRWRSAEEAVAYALTRARDMVRNQSAMLAC